MDRSQLTQGSELREHAQDVGNRIKDIGNLLKETVEEKLTEIRDGAVDYTRAGRERAQVARRDLEKYIGREPMKSVLIAAGVGVLLGFLLHRR